MEKILTFKEFVEIYYNLTKSLTYAKPVPNETNKMRSSDLRDVYAGKIIFQDESRSTVWIFKNKIGTSWQKKDKEIKLNYYFINDKNELDISFHSKRSWCLNNWKEVKYKKAEIAELFKPYENGIITYTELENQVRFNLKTDTMEFESFLTIKPC
jgi:hypothetical protein